MQALVYLSTDPFSELNPRVFCSSSSVLSTSCGRQDTGKDFQVTAEIAISRGAINIFHVKIYLNSGVSAVLMGELHSPLPTLILFLWNRMSRRNRGILRPLTLTGPRISLNFNHFNVSFGIRQISLRPAVIHSFCISDRMAREMEI